METRMYKPLNRREVHRHAQAIMISISGKHSQISFETASTKRKLVKCETPGCVKKDSLDKELGSSGSVFVYWFCITIHQLLTSSHHLQDKKKSQVYLQVYASSLNSATLLFLLMTGMSLCSFPCELAELLMSLFFNILKSEDPMGASVTWNTDRKALIRECNSFHYLSQRGRICVVCRCNCCNLSPSSRAAQSHWVLIVGQTT